MWDWIRRLFGAPQETAPTPTAGRRVSRSTLTEQEARVTAEFAEHYNIHFQRPELLKLALTHRSYLSVTGQGPRESNERLEFLGDSVLGLVTSEFLYREHPTEHEGQLTKTKSLLVSKAILSRRALAMGLGRFVLMSHSEVESGGRQRLSILADAFESVVGAVYLDQGFEASRAFIVRWLLRDSKEIAADKRHTNYKSHLQEFVQSTFRTIPCIAFAARWGRPLEAVHEVVGQERRVLGAGKGRNKKDAEQAAARHALEQVETGPRTGRPPSALPARAEAAVLPREPRRVEPERAAPPAVRPEAAEEEREGGRRRRGRRGGRRRNHETPGTHEASLEHEAPSEPTTEDVAVTPVPRFEPVRTERPPMQMRPMPERLPVSERPAPPEPEVEPRPNRWDDDLEEVGRPEGPSHEELHVDPFGVGEEVAPRTAERPSIESMWRPGDHGRLVEPLARVTPQDLGPDTESSETETREKPGERREGSRYGRRPGRGPSRGRR